MQIVDWFGERGAGAGQFATSLHDLAVDSKRNIYTGEAAAAGRVQKFLRRDPRPATSVQDLMYPTAVRSEIRQYLSRSRSYRSSRKLAKDAEGSPEMKMNQRIFAGNMIGIGASSIGAVIFLYAAFVSLGM